MNKINIKPLSVNEAWQGKRFKTQKYKDYEKQLSLLLPSKLIIPENIFINLEFGFSNSSSDWDNPIKPFVDILQKKYKFNDNIIYEAHVKKVKVKKGEEYIKFSLENS